MIDGEKTRLRAIEREDIPHFVEWLNDPEVAYYLGRLPLLSRADEEHWFEETVRDERHRILAIDTLEGVHIGSIGLHNLDWRNSSAELGIMIGDKNYWSKGYGRDAIRSLLRFGFGELNLHRIFLRVYDFNPRAIRCYENVGFKHEGVFREAVYINGGYQNELVMGLLRDEFLARGDGKQPTKTKIGEPTPEGEGRWKGG